MKTEKKDRREYQRAYMKEWRKRNPEAVIRYRKQSEDKRPGHTAEIARRYRLAHPKESFAYVKAWQQSNLEKLKTHREVTQAIRKGKLTRLPCQVCGDVKSHAHHLDYTKPLEVIWLCAKHHKQQHRRKLN